MSYTPAQNQKEQDRKIDAITKCGANRGPHDYIPISWFTDKESEHVRILMCRVCFTRINIKTCYDMGYEAKLT